MENEKDPPVIVVFRKVRYSDGEEILALFPTMRERNDLCVCYARIGQHSGADYRACVARGCPATPEEYASLKKELEDMGYSLIVRKRYSGKH